MVLLYRNSRAKGKFVTELTRFRALIRYFIFSTLVTGLYMNKGLAGLLQLIVLTVLFFVMMFGIGFILNMLMKTTWFPIYLFFIVVIPLIGYYSWNADKSFAGNLASYTYVDYITAVGGVLGAYVSGWAIRSLRRSGFKMF